MSLLSDLSGHDFEETMADVFRNEGYENVRVSQKSGDEGRDITMEEVVNGERRGVVVECKHQPRVGRPVIQKLHSAVTTHDFSGPSQGIIATTGTVSKAAREYTHKIRTQGDGTIIDIIQGSDLQERADGTGLNLSSGRVEIICDRTLLPTGASGSATKPVENAFDSVNNFDSDDLPPVESSVVFNPVVRIQAKTESEFRTSVGLIHRVNKHDSLLLRADKQRPALADDPAQTLAADGSLSTTSINNPRLDESFETSVTVPFENTKTEYMQWITDHLQQKHTSVVEYTGGNDVTYEKECVPEKSDIDVKAVEPVFVPEVSSQTVIQGHSYTFNYYAAGESREVIDDGIRRCTQCDGDKWWTNSFTYCDNCGSINCRVHAKTERIEGRPVCTGCAVTERFAFRRKYFYTEENREQFQDEYDRMALHEKALENKLGITGIVVTLIFVLILML